MHTEQSRAEQREEKSLEREDVCGRKKERGSHLERTERIDTLLCSSSFSSSQTAAAAAQHTEQSEREREKAKSSKNKKGAVRQSQPTPTHPPQLDYFALISFNKKLRMSS
jgi:hypothetical protein